MDCSLPVSSIHRFLQARRLEWVAITFSKGSSQPGDRTSLMSPSLAGGLFTTVVIQLPSHVRLFVTPWTAAWIRPLRPSPSPRVCRSSCPLHRWCLPAISSSDTLFSCHQSFPVSGTFPISQLFASDDQNTGVSASASVLPVSIQSWSPLRLTGLISLLSKGLQHHSSKALILLHSAFFTVQLPQQYVTSGKTIALTLWTFVMRVMSLLSTHCLGLSQLSCQEANVFWFHGCSHYPQWF